MAKIGFGSLRGKWLVLVPLGIVTAVVVSACAGGVPEERVAAIEGKVAMVEQDLGGVKGQVQTLGPKVGKVAEPTRERHFYVTGVEWKGSTDKLDPPSVDPKTLSDGYGYKAPGVFDPTNPKKWEVASYVWAPASMIAYQGDTVSLTIFIVNGDKHTTWVEAPDGTEVVKEVEMNRGREYEVSFKADQPGDYMLHCDEHDPTMHANILVLPR